MAARKAGSGVRGKTPVELGGALVRAFATNERMNQYLLEHLEPGVWDAAPPGRKAGTGRTIAAIVAHMHNVRHMWLVVSAKGVPAPAKLDPARVTQVQARTALHASAAALRALIEGAIANGGHVREFKPDVAGFVGYLVSHDAHHRGQICMLARDLGSPLPQEVAFGMWDWRKRSEEA